MSGNDTGSTKRKKVLFIICELYWGGAQKSMLKLVTEAAKKYDCTLAVNKVEDSFTQPVPVPLIEIDKACGITGEGFTPLHKLNRLYKRIKLIKKLKQQQHFDVCISFMEGADIINVLSRVKNCSTVTSIRGSIIQAVRKNSLLTTIHLKVVLPFIYKRSDVIVPVSTVLKDELVNVFHLPAAKVIPIQNFYDLDLYTKLANEPLEAAYLSIFNQGKIIISVGRLNLQKNFVNLVRIFARFRTKTNEHYQLVIIGDGEDHDMLMDECTKQKLSAYSFKTNPTPQPGYDVYFMGYRANPHQYVAKADCFLLTSSWEGFPNTFAEALLVGTPSIAADCKTGPFEIIQPTEGKSEYQLPAVLLPIPVTDEINEQWANTLQRITHEQPLRDALHRNALERMKDFSKEKIINKWFDIIEAKAS